MDYVYREPSEFDFSNVATTYRKVGSISKLDVEICTEEHEVVTLIEGKTETKNVAKVGDIIVTGKSGEKYVVLRDKFPKLYQVNPANISMYISKNVVKAIMLSEPISLTAPWGETQNGEVGSFVVQMVNDPSEVYIIARTAFFDTYAPCSD